MTSYIPPEEPNSEAPQLEIISPPMQPLIPPTGQPELAPSPLVPPQRLPGWRFWVPLALQAALVLVAPLQNTYTYVSGKTVTLQTVPVDPYDVLRGYSQVLSYSISDAAALGKLPGGTWFSQRARGQGASFSFYIVLEAPPKTNATPPLAWKPVRISGDRPTNLPSNQVALKGQYDGWRIIYGLETFYMPEDQREQINRDISQTRGQQGQKALKVDAKVDSSGNAVLVNLWVDDRQYH